MGTHAARRTRKTTVLLATELAIAVSVISVGGVRIATTHAPSEVTEADSVGISSVHGPLAPFAATPVVEPLVPSPVVSTAEPRQPKNRVTAKGGAVSTPAASPQATVPRSSPTAAASNPGDSTASNRGVPKKTAATASRHRHRPQTPAAAIAAGRLPTTKNVKVSDIPTKVRAAYRNAARMADTADRKCHLQWQPLAGIGYIESDNAAAGGSANPRWDGIAYPPILGAVLNGKHGTHAVPDTDGGLLDGNRTWDRAVGPMQFLPSTWTKYAADGDHDGVANPQDIDDAALTAATFLCATGHHLNRPGHLIHAIHTYTHSYRYVRAVLTVTAHYEHVRPGALGVNRLPHPVKQPGTGGGHGSTPPTTGSSPTPTPTPSASATPTPVVSLMPSEDPAPSASDSVENSPVATP